MPVYCFALHDKVGRLVETLGDLPLEDEAESVAFAKGVIRDLMRNDGRAYYAGCLINITEGERGIDSIPFGPITPS